MRGLPRPSARVLWIVAAVLAAALTGFWLRPHESSRDKVAHYIEQANETGRQFTAQYSGAEAAYRTFATAPGKHASTAKLRVAARRLTKLRVVDARQQFLELGNARTEIEAAHALSSSA